MTGLDYFSWVVFICIFATLIVGFVVLAKLPGKIATNNGHPQARAITTAGWLGLLFTGGIGWIIAMVWAQMEATAGDSGGTDAQARIAALEAELAALKEASQ
ncbi:MAG: DUF3302 domain-containing protein [Pseudomonadota bacterium]